MDRKEENIIVEDLMREVMNIPVDYNWTEEDVIREYNIYKDKKKVARIYCLTDKEVTEILKRIKD